MKRTIASILAVVLLCTTSIAQKGTASVVTDITEGTNNIAVLPNYLPAAIKNQANQVHQIEIHFTKNKKGVVHGYNKAGELVMRTGFAKTKLHGIWHTITEKGSFEKNIPHGRWEYTTQKGSVWAIREYHAIKYHSITQNAKRYHPKRNHYTLAKLAQSNKSYLDQATQVHININQHDYTAPFTQGLHHGVIIDYFENGVVQDSGYYYNGLKDGDWSTFYPNGKMNLHGYYQHGQKHGTWMAYNLEGELVKLTHFSNGKEEYSKIYNPPVKPY